MVRPKPKAGAIALDIDDVETVKVFESNAFDYGIMTLEDRALPDYRDGLLKVHRRVLWAMYGIAKASGPYVKTARVVGETMGKYHPHGDAPVLSALETMVWSPSSPCDASGNWGSQTDNAAAQRYTNIRMSKYADQYLFDREYLDTILFHPNYDGKDKEPQLLPAMLPNLLLNGASGIAVGLNTNIPAFKKDGLMKLVKGCLQGKKLTVKACMDNLDIVFPFGGHVPKEEWQEERLTALFKTGKGSVYAYCDHSFDPKARTLHITGIPPKCNPDTLMDKLRGTDYFVSVQDRMGKQSTTPADIVCVFKKSVNLKEAQEYLYNEMLYVTLPYQMVMIERYYDEEQHKIKAHIYQWGVIEFLNNWIVYRKELEASMLVCKAEGINKEIERRGWLLLAQENRKLLALSWEQDNQKEYIKDKLDVEDDAATYIINLRLAQLGKLDRDKLNAEVLDLKKQLKRVRHLEANIEESILESL